MGIIRRSIAVEYKSATAAAAQSGGVIGDEHDPMVFDILGSVTGVIDEVKDIVVPGAFEDTLARRTPKIIKDHDWGQRLGTVLQIRELKPGHPDMPAHLPSGDPWPAGAGALLAKVRLFNSPEGHQAAERWRTDPAQQFSIGYVPRKAVQRKSDKVRLLAQVDLLEISDVLWGAMPLCGMMPGALATKMLPTGDDDALPADVDDDTADAFEAALHRMAEDQTDWSSGGTATPDAPPADTSPGTTAEAKAEGGADRNRGNVEALRKWYVSGEGAAKIKWGTPGDFDRCVRIAGKHMGERAKGYCQLRHVEATGRPAGHAPGEEKTADGGSVEVSPASYDAPGTKAMTYDPTLERGDFAGTTIPVPAVRTLEVKDYPRFPGTFEERLEVLRNAVRDRLQQPRDPAPDTEDSGTAKPAPLFSDGRWNHIGIDATWADRVIATRVRYCAGDAEDRESFEMGYLWDGQTITLGAPVPIRLTVTAVAVAGEDGGLREDPRVAATATAVKDITAALAGIQTKAGRVLSTRNAGRLQEAIQSLMSVAAAAGLTITPVGAPAPSATRPAPDTTTTAPSAQTTELKTLPRAEVDAILQRLGDGGPR